MTPNVFEYRYSIEDKCWECLLVDTNNSNMKSFTVAEDADTETVLKTFKKNFD